MDDAVKNSRPPTRRRFLASGLAAGSLPFVPGITAKAATPKLKIGFYTDLHTRVEWGTPDAILSCAEQINREKPDLVIAGGDLITDGFQASEESVEPRWDAYMKMHEAIEAPLHAVIGNHDLVAAMPEDGSPAAEDPRAVFRRKMKVENTYRSFDVNGIHFMLLDPFEITGGEAKFRGFFGEEQMEWIVKDMEKTPVDQPTVVVTHMPLLSAFWQATRGSDLAMPTRYIVENGRSLVKLFRGRNVKAVLQGHTHVNAMIVWRGIKFITGGAVCAKWWRGPWYGTEEGYGVLDVTADAADWRYVDMGWEARRPPDQ